MGATYVFGDENTAGKRTKYGEHVKLKIRMWGGVGLKNYFDETCDVHRRRQEHRCRRRMEWMRANEKEKIGATKAIIKDIYV